jgi:hypothetical protein
MPTISVLGGIVFRMDNNDHLHADNAKTQAVYAIKTPEVLEGGVLRRAHNLVLEWASEHRAELMVDWNLARHSEPLFQISPLE